MSTPTTYAGFWRRAIASLLDNLVVGLLSFIIGMVAFAMFNVTDEQSMQTVFNLVAKTNVIFACYCVWFWVKRGATPGKQALDLYVVDALTGKPLTTQKSVIRYVGYIISAIPFGLGFLWAAFDKRKQGWHDKLAGSVVIHRPETAYFEG